MVVWKCSTMECGVQCVMTPGTSMMPLQVERREGGREGGEGGEGKEGSV